MSEASITETRQQNPHSGIERIELLAWALDQEQLAPAPHAVLAMTAVYAEHGGLDAERLDDLAERLDRKPATVRRHLAQLARDRLIRIERDSDGDVVLIAGVRAVTRELRAGSGAYTAAPA